MRKALEVYYLSEGASDQVRITVPKGGYVPAFSYAEPSFEHRRPTRAGTTLDQSRLLVVAPSPLPESDPCRMIAHSLFEQLTVELARYNDFSVALPEGAEATMQFGTSPYALANEYDARFVVTGGAGQTGDKVRMTIRLHDVRTETIIWTESFDFNFGAETLVETQDRTARRVAADIADFHGVICRLLSVEAASRDDGWSAHTAILRHRYIARITNERVYRRARADLSTGLRSRLIIPCYGRLSRIRYSPAMSRVSMRILIGWASSSDTRSIRSSLITDVPTATSLRPRLAFTTATSMAPWKPAGASWSTTHTRQAQH